MKTPRHLTVIISQSEPRDSGTFLWISKNANGTYETRFFSDNRWVLAFDSAATENNIQALILRLTDAIASAEQTEDELREAVDDIIADAQDAIDNANSAAQEARESAHALPGIVLTEEAYEELTEYENTLYFTY